MEESIITTKITTATYAGAHFSHASAASVDTARPTIEVDRVDFSYGKSKAMVFQKSNPFPKSIYENIAYGLRIAGIRDGRKWYCVICALPLRRRYLFRDFPPGRFVARTKVGSFRRTDACLSAMGKVSTINLEIGSGIEEIFMQ